MSDNVDRLIEAVRLAVAGSLRTVTVARALMGGGRLRRVEAILERAERELAELDVEGG